MKVKTSVALGLAMSALFAGTASAGDYVTNYEVKVTNLTRGQVFAPIMVGTHRFGASLYTLGMPASTALGLVAEGGNPTPLVNAFKANPKVSGVATSSGPVLPGKTVTIYVTAASGANRFSLAGMLADTNDSFIGLDSVYLPASGKTMYVAPAYDAGTEPNDELCAHIPGPACGGEGISAGDGEGYVHVSGGVQGIGDLNKMEYDWRNPVAQISIRRMP